MLEESNILVVIRVRPLNSKEILAEEFEIVRIEDNLIVVVELECLFFLKIDYPGPCVGGVLG
jgi:hypothetical protein